jgi:hypothetical protein
MGEMAERDAGSVGLLGKRIGEINGLWPLVIFSCVNAWKRTGN